jgi:UDP-N-acetylglucosamine 2-epimerase (non-hydrolysing)
LRDSIERPEALDSGSILNPGIEPDAVARAVWLTTKERSGDTLPEGYEEQNFSHKVLYFLNSTAGLSKLWKGIR